MLVGAIGHDYSIAPDAGAAIALEDCQQLVRNVASRQAPEVDRRPRPRQPACALRPNSITARRLDRNPRSSSSASGGRPQYRSRAPRRSCERRRQRARLHGEGCVSVELRSERGTAPPERAIVRRRQTAAAVVVAVRQPERPLVSWSMDPARSAVRALYQELTTHEEAHEHAVADWQSAFERLHGPLERKRQVDRTAIGRAYDVDEAEVSLPYLLCAVETFLALSLLASVEVLAASSRSSAKSRWTQAVRRASTGTGSDLPLTQLAEPYVSHLPPIADEHAVEASCISRSRRGRKSSTSTSCSSSRSRASDSGGATGSTTPAIGSSSCCETCIQYSSGSLSHLASARTVSFALASKLPHPRRAGSGCLTRLGRLTSESLWCLLVEIPPEPSQVCSSEAPSGGPFGGSVAAFWAGGGAGAGARLSRMCLGGRPTRSPSASSRLSTIFTAMS